MGSSHPRPLGHRTIYGRLRDIGQKTIEYLALHSGSAASAFGDGVMLDQRVLNHFDRKDVEEIWQEGRALLEAADDGEGRMRRIISAKEANWWAPALRRLDHLPHPDLSDIDAWREFVSIQSFGRQEAISLPLLRALSHECGWGSVPTVREEAEEFYRRNADRENAEQLARIIEKRSSGSANGHGLLGLKLQDQAETLDVSGDLIQVRGAVSRTYAQSAAGRQIDEVIDHPWMNGLGIRILSAEIIGDIMLIETDAHDEHNTVERVRSS